MQVLVGWDDPKQAELIGLYLNSGENDAVIVSDRARLLHEARNGRSWDVMLMGIDSARMDADFATFQEMRRTLPDCPIVGACQPEDVFRIARFLTNGMRSYVIRDAAGDFVFLLQSTLESTVESVRAEREQIISERLREEVESVRKLQQSIIPRDLSSPAGYTICARYESSQIRVLGGRPVILAGGDYYDVFRLDDASVVLLLGDASGHGMKACMSIMTMHTLIRMIRNEDYQDTATFVSEVNRRLCEQQIIHDEGGFITLLFGVLRADTHQFQWTSAGHPMPLLHDLTHNRVEPLGSLDAGGLPLGVLPEAEYEIHTSPVPPHSRLLLYTDGLEEAFPENNYAHAEFGRKGVERVLESSCQRPLEEALQALFDESHAFTRGMGRHDDTSVVLVERT